MCRAENRLKKWPVVRDQGPIKALFFLTTGHGPLATIEGSMNTIRFIMLGGFLGAGKTTAMARLARYYMDRGQRVGLVTNDQAQDLVDTHTLREQGFPVEEVAGACFCCKFND